jgi:hypothetical protein
MRGTKGSLSVATLRQADLERGDVYNLPLALSRAHAYMSCTVYFFLISTYYTRNISKNESQGNATSPSAYMAYDLAYKVQTKTQPKHITSA